MRSHVLNAVLTAPFSWSSPDTGTAVRVFKAEPGLGIEDDLGPSMTSASALSCSFVGGRQLWSLCWVTSPELDSMQAVDCSRSVW